MVLVTGVITEREIMVEKSNIDYIREVFKNELPKNTVDFWKYPQKFIIINLKKEITIHDNKQLIRTIVCSNSIKSIKKQF